MVKQNKEGQKRSYVQLTLTGSKIAEKRLTETYGKEKNRLQPTDIGMVVNDYLESQFEPIMDYNFTANVEKEFDRIADGEITWNSMIDDFTVLFIKWSIMRPRPRRPKTTRYASWAPTPLRGIR